MKRRKEEGIRIRIFLSMGLEVRRRVVTGLVELRIHKFGGSCRKREIPKKSKKRMG